MNKIASLIAAAALLLASYTVARAEVLVYVNKSQQEMVVLDHNTVVGIWPVSTARPGKVTPSGEFRPQWLSPNHRSSLYNNAPMPHSIFFNGNIAVHGTDQIGTLGTPASAGCVRLHPEHAQTLYRLVELRGAQHTRIVVDD